MLISGKRLPKDVFLSIYDNVFIRKRENYELSDTGILWWEWETDDAERFLTDFEIEQLERENIIGGIIS